MNPVNIFRSKLPVSSLPDMKEQSIPTTSGLPRMPFFRERFVYDVKNKYKMCRDEFINQEGDWPGVLRNLDEIKESSVIIKADMFHVKVLMMDFNFDKTLNRDIILNCLKEVEKVNNKTDNALLDIINQTFRDDLWVKPMTFRDLRIRMLEDVIIASFFEYKNSNVINQLVDNLQDIYASSYDSSDLSSSGYLNLQDSDPMLQGITCFLKYPAIIIHLRRCYHDQYIPGPYRKQKGEQLNKILKEYQASLIVYLEKINDLAQKSKENNKKWNILIKSFSDHVNRSIFKSEEYFLIYKCPQNIIDSIDFILRNFTQNRRRREWIDEYKKHLMLFGQSYNLLEIQIRDNKKSTGIKLEMLRRLVLYSIVIFRIHYSWGCQIKNENIRTTLRCKDVVILLNEVLIEGLINTHDAKDIRKDLLQDLYSLVFLGSAFQRHVRDDCCVENQYQDLYVQIESKLLQLYWF